MNKAYAILNPSTGKFIAESDVIGLYEEDDPFFFDNFETMQDIISEYETDIKCEIVTISWEIKTE